MQKLEMIIKGAFRFQDYSLARSFAARTIKASGIILGDDGRFWVLPLGQAEYLHRRGYQYAE